jgi:hypothetical protein
MGASARSEPESKATSRTVELFDGEMLYAKSGNVERWIDKKLGVVCYKHGDEELGCANVRDIRITGK